MAGLSAGNLDREISLETATVTQDEDSGENIKTWTSETIAAQWLPAGTREAWRAGDRLQSTIDGIFRIYDMDIRPTASLSRVVFEGRAYDIEGVMESAEFDAGLDLVVVASADA